MHPKFKTEHYLDLSNPSNWNFLCQTHHPTSGCPDEQIFDCYEYEYSREMVLSQGTTLKSLVEIQDKRLNAFYKLFQENFPGTPWLDIPADVRSESLRALAQVWPSVPAFEAVPIEKLQQDGEIKNELEWVQIEYENNQVTVLPVQIGWHHSDDEILNAFKAWISTYRPAKMVPSAEGRGKDERSSIKRALKELGAYRLLRTLSAKEASELTLKARGATEGAMYASAKGWSQAKKNAKDLLNKWLQPSAHLPDLKMELPTDAKFPHLPPLSRLRRWLACGENHQVVQNLARKMCERQYFSRALLVLGEERTPIPFTLTRRWNGISDQESESLVGKRCALMTAVRSPYTDDEISINRKHLGFDDEQ